MTFMSQVSVSVRSSLCSMARVKCWMVVQAMQEAAEALKTAEADAALSPVPLFLTAEKTSPRILSLRHICKQGLPANETENEVTLVSFSQHSNIVRVVFHECRGCELEFEGP